MLKILVNAYACSPHTGSEPGMAWNWCAHLAKHCELHIITEGEFKAHIEKALETLPQAGNMHFYYNPVSAEVRIMCWNQGDWRFYKHYKKWQYKTYKMAIKICETQHIDIVHQLNMIGFREPGYLWKIKEIPFVWGPVDAKDKFPIAYLQGLPFKTKSIIYLKNLVTILQLRYSIRVRHAVKRASYVISASSNSQTSFKKYFNIDSPLLNETGCSIKPYSSKEANQMLGPLHLLWVGKFDFRKQLKLALRAIANCQNKNVVLHIIGGRSDMLEAYAKKLGVSEHCKWHGIIPHAEVQALMQHSDLLFFTSVAEGTPHVVLEAIANRLPVLCIDTCGQGDVINTSVGRKIPLSNPEQSIKDFALQINILEGNRILVQEMAANCEQRQKELSWDEKARTMLDSYENCLQV